MEIKAKTRFDKFYDFIMSYITVIIIILVAIACSIIYGILIHKQAEKLSLKNAEIVKQEHIKIETIKQTKPILICDSHKLNKEDYDLVVINEVPYIIYDGTKQKLGGCSIYSKLTNSMVIKPKVVIPIDVKHKREVDNLTTRLDNVTKSQNILRTNNTAVNQALVEANGDIVVLKQTIDKQKKEIDRLLIIEAKYIDTKEMIMVVLNKKNIHIKDLMIKPKKPKKQKQLPKKIAKIEPHKVKTVESIEITSDKQYIRRLLYAIRFLGSKSDVFVENGFSISSPSKKELDSIKVTEEQIKNFKHIVPQLKKVVDTLSKGYDSRFKQSKGHTRNSIMINVGV